MPPISCALLTIHRRAPPQSKTCAQVRFVMRHNGIAALNESFPASSTSMQTSLPLVSDAYGRIAAHPQVVEREGEFGLEWLVSWKPPRLGQQRVQCVCFAALVNMGPSQMLSQSALVMSVPHCITFLLVPDPPPVWAASALELAPLRIVMGTLVTVQLQATDDNPDDSIQLESLTLPANMPSFVKMTPGVEFVMVGKLSSKPSII